MDCECFRMGRVTGRLLERLVKALRMLFFSNFGSDMEAVECCPTAKALGKSLQRVAKSVSRLSLLKSEAVSCSSLGPRLCALRSSGLCSPVSPRPYVLNEEKAINLDYSEV